MKLGEKIRYLREVEGSIRGLDREMTQQEIVRAVKKELGAGISQSYLSQIESGSRPHLTNTTRMLLARFFKVHPGYLVDDPEGYHTELMSDVRTLEERLDLWLVAGAERFRRDPQVRHALLEVAKHADSRGCLEWVVAVSVPFLNMTPVTIRLVLLGAILETPGLAERLLQVLKPEGRSAGPDNGKRRRNGDTRREEIL